MKRLLSACLVVLFATVCFGEVEFFLPRHWEKLTQLQTLWSLLNPTKDLSSEFDVAQNEPEKVDGLVDRIVDDSPALKKCPQTDMLVANTGSRDRWGICFIGNAPKPDAPIIMYKNDVGNVLPVQAVDNPDGKTCSLYANFEFGERPSGVPKLGFMPLSRVEPQEVPKLPSSLYINVETGEMGNDTVRLVINKKNGTISSLKLKGNDHEFVDAGGLDDYRYTVIDAGVRHPFGPFRLTVVASGPFAATMQIEAAPSSEVIIKRRVTIFDDTEKIRIENFIERSKEKELGGVFFAFPFNIPGGKKFVDSHEKLLEVEDFVMRKHDYDRISFRRFAVFCNDTLGVNWVPVDDRTPQIQSGGFVSHVGKKGRYEYWLWPYVASFDVAVAQRFGRQVCQPLIRLPGHTLAAPKPAPLKFENEENVVISKIRPVPGGSGSLTVTVENVTGNPVSTRIRPQPPYKKIYRSNSTEEIGEIPLKPFETMTVVVE